jgi:adenosylcobinamide-GDP ribazoletransferase
MKTVIHRFFIAAQFLTRIPVPRSEYWEDDLAKAAAFFPLIGLLLACGGLLLHFLLLPHVTLPVFVLLLVVYLVLVTGGLHEDALGDAADGFGGGWDKEQTLTIMHDSRIGSYGAIAIALSLLSRFVFLSQLPVGRFAAYFVAGQVLSRWTAIPLSCFLPAARASAGQGSLVAGRVSWRSLVAGTVLAFGTATAFLKARVLWVAIGTVVVCALSGLYYQRRLGGITGDCLGATIQLSEIGVYLAGVIVQ